MLEQCTKNVQGEGPIGDQRSNAGKRQKDMKACCSLFSSVPGHG